MLKFKLSKKAITVKRIQSTIILIILSFIFGGISVFFFTTAAILFILAIIVYILIVFPILQLWYKSYSYEISKDCIKIKKGVFVSKDICILKNRIQYSALIQTPLQRHYRTCTIIYHTAGAVVYLSEIDEEFSNGAMFNEKL